MSDIVERLRIWPLRRGYSEMSIRRTMRDAADEIEKLRAALNTFVAAVPKDCVLVSRVATEQMDARIVAFETEIKKLRARGCARDQTTTQYCAEVIERDAEIEKMRAALRKLYDHEGERVLNSLGIECYTEELEDALCEARAALGEKE